MIDVIFTSMRPELDFTLEGENMDAFRDRVGDFDTLAIPDVLFATPRVLVQGLAKGKSIRDVDKSMFTEEQREAIGRDLLTFQFWGFFVDRQFHADPTRATSSSRPTAGRRSSTGAWSARSTPTSRCR